jgi:hypothetical protein
MFDCSWTYDVDSAELEKMINQLVDARVNKKLKDIKVQIPQEQINNAVVKFFTEKKWFLTENGKKLDTYDLIRKFAMNTIGVSENGELNSEMLNVVQQEVGKILADQIYNNAKNKVSVDTGCKCGGNCACKGHTDVEPVLAKDDDIVTEYEEQAYNDGYSDGKIDAVNEINNMLADYDTGFNIWWDGDKIMFSAKCNKSCSESDETPDENPDETREQDLDFITNFAETLSGSKLTSAQKTALKNLYDVLKTTKE